MNPSDANGVKKPVSWLMTNSSSQAKVALILGLTIFYVATFQPIVERYSIITAPLVAIPVVLVGWFFGGKAGFFASLIAIVLNALLFSLNLTDGWKLWNTTTWPGNLMIIVVGVIAGHLHKIINNSIHIEAELRSRERHLTLLNMATSDILSPKEAVDRYYYLLTHLVNLFVADYGYLVLWDTTLEQTVLVASTFPSEKPFPNIQLETSELAVIETALRTRHAQVINNTSNLGRAINPQLISELPFSSQSALIVPLIAKEHKLGAAMLAYNKPHPFSDREIERAEQGGQQVALALWTVQQETDIQKRLREANALANISRALSETEHVGLSTVLQLIVSSAKELIPTTEQAVIHLLDEEQQILTAEAVVGYSDNVTSWKLLKIHPNEGVAGLVIVSGETINIADVRTDPRFLTTGTPPSYRSLMVAPVRSGERKLGTISVQSGLINAFTQDERRLLTELGTQATIAIENAHLLETTQQALKEANALHRINQGLIASLDAQELFEDVVELLKKNFGYYHVQIFVADPETEDFVLRAASGEVGRRLKEQGYRLHAGEGIIGHTAETGTAFFTNNVDEVLFFIRNPLLPDTKSELAMPVKSGDQILGVLDIQQVPPNCLTQRDLQLVSAVADQLAIALQKAELYSDLQASLQVEKAIRNQMVQSERLSVMGRLLASVSHELNNPLQAIQNALFLLRDEKGISAQGKQDLEIVLSEAERMSELIGRLRATYRATQMEDFQPAQVNDIIEDVYALIATHLRHNEISFEFHPDSNLPMISVLTDQIRQVLLNLLMNAVEAMTTGGKLTVSTHLLADSNEVLLRISDTGLGIDPSILPNIFEPFVTDKERGTGLGLTITYDIILKHRGRIQAENNPRGGATFSVWLPVESRNIG